jgi:hypothetical protein
VSLRLARAITALRLSTCETTCRRPVDASIPTAPDAFAEPAHQMLVVTCEFEPANSPRFEQAVGGRRGHQLSWRFWDSEPLMHRVPLLAMPAEIFREPRRDAFSEQQQSESDSTCHMDYEDPHPNRHRKGPGEINSRGKACPQAQQYRSITQKHGRQPVSHGQLHHANDAIATIVQASLTESCK